MQGYRPIIAINIVVLLIVCVFVVRFAGWHGGAGKATAASAAPGDVAANEAVGKDAATNSTNGSAVAAPADDGR